MLTAPLLARLDILGLEAWENPVPWIVFVNRIQVVILNLLEDYHGILSQTEPGGSAPSETR